MIRSSHTKWFGKPAERTAVFLSPLQPCSNITPHPGWVGGKGAAEATVTRHRPLHTQQEGTPTKFVVPKAANESTLPSLQANHHADAHPHWVGGKGGAAAATTRRKQQHKQVNDEPSLLEAVEATTRTIRLGLLQEQQLLGALQQLLHRYDVNSNYQEKQQDTRCKTTQEQCQGYSMNLWSHQRGGQQSYYPTTTQQKHWSTDAPQPAACKVQLRQPQQQQRHIQGFITSEWQHIPELTTAEMLLDAISNGKDLPGNIAEVDEQQCEDITDAWQAFEPSEGFTLFWQGNTPPAEGSTRRVRAQLLGNSQFVPTQLVLRSFGTNCPFPKAATMAKIPQDLATQGRCFLRITAPQHFRQVFRSSNKPDEPSQILAEISNWQLPAATLGQLTGGDWQRLWTKQGNHIQGHIKVRNALAEQLLKKSGHKAIFFTKTGAREGQSKVQWHKRQQEETDEDYFRRVANLASGSAIRFRTGGATDLGTDSSDTTSNGQRRAHFELQGCPAQWDDQDLISFLESNQWAVHTIHSQRKGYKGSTTWMIDATCPVNPDGGDSFFYEGDLFNIYIFPRAPGRRKNSYREPLWGPEQKWGTTKQQPKDKAEPEERPGKRHCPAIRGEHPEASEHRSLDAAQPAEAAQTQLDPTTQSQKKRDAPELDQAPALPPDPANPEHIEHAIASGWQEKDNGGVGDCFFRSIIKAENHWNNKVETDQQIQKAALDLRLEAVKHIRKHRQDYEAAWVHDDMERQYQRAGQPPPKDFDDFLTQASKKSYWANEHLIQAASTRTGIPIVIWRAYTGPSEPTAEVNSADSKTPQPQPGKKLWHRGIWAPSFKQGIAASNNKCKGITLILRANHYTCVLPPEHQQIPPTPWLRQVHSSHPKSECPGLTLMLRGGITPAFFRHGPRNHLRLGSGKHMKPLKDNGLQVVMIPRPPQRDPLA